MFLRHTKRKKDGKEHRYWSIVENRRIGGGRVVQRPLLYLGEITDSQELAWRKSIAILEEGALQPRTHTMISRVPFPNCRSGVIGLAIAGNPENDGHLSPWQEAVGHEIIPDTHKNGCANEAMTGLTLELFVMLFQDV